MATGTAASSKPTGAYKIDTRHWTLDCDRLQHGSQIATRACARHRLSDLQTQYFNLTYKEQAGRPHLAQFLRARHERHGGRDDHFGRELLPLLLLPVLFQDLPPDISLSLIFLLT